MGKPTRQVTDAEKRLLADVQELRAAIESALAAYAAARPFSGEAHLFSENARDSYATIQRLSSQLYGIWRACAVLRSPIAPEIGFIWDALEEKTAYTIATHAPERF